MKAWILIISFFVIVSSGAEASSGKYLCKLFMYLLRTKHYNFYNQIYREYGILVHCFTLLYIQVFHLRLSETPRNLQILQIKICNRNRLWHNYSSREAQELFQNFEILKPVWQNKTAAYYTTIKFNNLRYFRFFPRLRYDILFCHIKMQSCFSATTSFTGCLIAP